MLGKNNNIGRLLFWFRDNDAEMYNYTRRFTPLAMLLNRLINENYKGKKIKFLNIYFNTPTTFEHFPKLQLNYTHSYGGHVQHDSVFSRKDFDTKSLQDQKSHLWDMAFKVMKIISKDTKNLELEKCVDLAYKKGIELNFNENFIFIQENFTYESNPVNVELWFEFESEKVNARLKIVYNNKTVFDKVIDKASADTEFFYEMYKKILLDSKGCIILKGHFEIEYLPMKISLNDKI